MVNNILFSIVIPTYNSKNTIIRCIESCISQTYEIFEIIVVDDCSSDNTVEVLRKYIKKENIKNITIYELNINSGASSARNMGMEYAKGDYIALLDSDDFFHKKKLEIVNKIVSTNKSIDLLGHDYYFDSEVGNTPDITSMSITKISCCKLLLKNFAVTPSVVFKKSIKVFFNTNMRYTEDHDFFLRVCTQGYKIYYMDIKLVGLNRGILSAGGQSSNNFKMRLGEIKMYINLYKVDLKYILLIPFLVLFSILKHIIKIIK